MFNFFKKNKIIEIGTPVSGEIISIEDVPDAVFSEKMIGDGVAIEPSEGLVLSPVDGEIVSLFPTNHAIGIRTYEGLEILIHIGLDTVELKGEGFKRITSENAKVKKGDPLMEFDIDFIKSMKKSPITPVVITNMDMVKDIVKNSGKVQISKDIVMSIKY